MTIAGATMYANPFLLWTNLALRTGEMMWASSQVMGHRTSRMLLAHPNYSVRDRREIVLMGQEKIEAAYESASAMSAGLAKMSFELGMFAFKQWFAAATAFRSLATSRTLGQYFRASGKAYPRSRDAVCCRRNPVVHLRCADCRSRPEADPFARHQECKTPGKALM